MAQEERHKRTKRLLAVLNERTPLAAVLQDFVASYLNGPTTLFVADCNNHVIRAVNLETFSVRTLVGEAKRKGHADGKGRVAKVYEPNCLAVEKENDTLILAQRCCVCRLTPDGFTTTLSGEPKSPGYCEGLGKECRFFDIRGAVVVERTLFVSDCCNHVVRRIALDRNGASQLFAGAPKEQGFMDGTHAKFNYPEGLAADSSGNVFLADCGNHRIRKISPAGVVSTVAGLSRNGHCDGPLKEAWFSWPADVEFDGRGRLLVADYCNHVVRSIDFEAGLVTTLAGQPGCKGHVDGPATEATLNLPCCLAVDIMTGNVFIGCRDHTIRCVGPDGTVNTVCGKTDQVGHVDSIGTEARFDFPRGLALL